MKKTNRLKTLILAVLLIVGGSLLFYFGKDIQNILFHNEDLQQSEQRLEDERTRNQQLEIQLQAMQQSLNEAQEKLTEVPEDSTDRMELLKNFGENWVNYASIYERNQSVKSFLTDKAIEENAIDIDAHADFKGEGEIQSIFQDVNHSDKYSIVGNEKAKELESILMIEVEFASGEDKIDVIRVYYVRQIV